MPSTPPLQPHQMTTSMALGQWGEERVLTWLRQYQWPVEDVRDNLFMQAMDVDFLVATMKGFVAVDVKTDQYTRNIYIEEYSTYHPDQPALNRPGWGRTTQADYLAYYFCRLGWVYWVPVRALREWMSHRLADFEAKHPLNWHWGTKVVSSQGRPVPRWVIEREVAGTVVIKGLPVKED